MPSLKMFQTKITLLSSVSTYSNKQQINLNMINTILKPVATVILNIFANLSAINCSLLSTGDGKMLLSLEIILYLSWGSGGLPLAILLQDGTALILISALLRINLSSIQDLFITAIFCNMKTISWWDLFRWFLQTNLASITTWVEHLWVIVSKSWV